MGSLCEESVDNTVGGLVWVRRRNGCWWPGRILGNDELPDGCVVGPRAGTPVKLLGREDGNVDWYNFERSKRVKPFRCGEYDECIEKAKITASISSNRKLKYACREGAILHALMLEKSRLYKENPKTTSDINKSDPEQSDEETENMSDKVSSLESHSVSPPEHHPSALVNDSEDDGSKRRMRGLKDIGIGVKTKPPVKRKRSQVVHVLDHLKKKNRRHPLTKVLKLLPVTDGKSKNLNGKRSFSDRTGDYSGRLFDIPLIAGSSRRLVPDNGQVAVRPSGQSGLVETVSGGPGEIQESDSISSGAAGANDINYIMGNNGTSKWQHKGKRNSRNKSKTVQKILDSEVKIESNLIEAPQRLMPCRQSRFIVNPKYQSSFVYNKSDTGSLYKVNIEVQASHIPQHIPYISLMSRFTGRAITGQSLLVEVLNYSVSALSLNGSEFISSSCELDGVDVGTVPEASKKSKIRSLSSLTGSKKPGSKRRSETVKKLEKPDGSCVSLDVVYGRLYAALGIN